MTDHPMFLEYDWSSNTYRSHLGGAFTWIEPSFETLADARLQLRLIGLRIGAKTDSRTWRIEFKEPVAERVDAFRLGSWANRNRERIKRPDPSAYRQNGCSTGGTAALEAQSRTLGGQAILKHAGSPRSGLPDRRLVRRLVGFPNRIGAP
jgi:hypothetical protein